MTTQIPLKNAEKHDAKVQKVAVKIPQPFAEGHKLRANEAEALNAYYTNCVRNGIAADVKDMLTKAGAFDSEGNINSDKVDSKAVQKMVDDYVNEYDFGMTTGRTGDPVEREAMEIARNAVRSAIQRKGGNVSDYSGKQISTKAKELMQNETYGPKFREKAKQIVNAREEVTEIDI